MIGKKGDWEISPFNLRNIVFLFVVVFNKEKNISNFSQPFYLYSDFKCIFVHMTHLQFEDELFCFETIVAPFDI